MSAAYDEREHLPVCVYGTLRPGDYNAVLVEDLLGPVYRGTLDGWALYGVGRGFPYAIPEPGRRIVVDVLTFPSEVWGDALRRLDQLEGYPTHYDRRPVSVRLDDSGEHITCWTYTPPDPERTRRTVGRIESGDWFARDAARFTPSWRS